jgi:glycosyltransferase 2 family protein
MIRASGKAAAMGRLIGWVAIAASIGFIGLQLGQQAPWQLAATHLRTLAAAVIAGVLLYGMAGFLLSSAWYYLLGAVPSSASIREHHAVYGRTQIAKYLPGNVFHMVGRQVMGRRLGHGQARLALASLLEVILLLLAAGLLSLPLLWPWLDPELMEVLGFAGLVLALPVARWLCRRHHLALRKLAISPGGFGLQAARSIALRLLLPALLYALFFFVTAAILWMLATSVGGPDRPSIDFATVVSAVALAWLVGFATPGSSAGIGVREAVLIAALEGTLGASVSGLIALALRMVSVGGDAMFFALAMTLADAEDLSKSMEIEDHPA